MFFPLVSALCKSIERDLLRLDIPKSAEKGDGVALSLLLSLLLVPVGGLVPNSCKTLRKSSLDIPSTSPGRMDGCVVGSSVVEVVVVVVNRVVASVVVVVVGADVLLLVVVVVVAVVVVVVVGRVGEVLRAAGVASCCSSKSGSPVAVS